MQKRNNGACGVQCHNLKMKCLEKTFLDFQRILNDKCIWLWLYCNILGTTQWSNPCECTCLSQAISDMTEWTDPWSILAVKLLYTLFTTLLRVISCRFGKQKNEKQGGEANSCKQSENTPKHYVRENECLHKYWMCVQECVYAKEWEKENE